jgi:sporadic carbohydrate cluster protein (TIGR04323 family)
MSGVRGYIFSRPFMGERVPQHVQNLVIRDYCQKKGIQYLLSATEYSMAGSHLILEQIMDELPQLEGLVFYSLFLLPEQKKERERVCKVILENKKTIFFAVEGLHMSNQIEFERIETIWQVQKILPKCLQNIKIPH